MVNREPYHCYAFSENRHKFNDTDVSSIGLRMSVWVDNITFSPLALMAQRMSFRKNRNIYIYENILCVLSTAAYNNNINKVYIKLDFGDFD